MGPKIIPPLGGVPGHQDPPGIYRGRFDGPPFEDIPPGIDPPIPGYEPSPFEKPTFGIPGLLDRERLPPPNYREPMRLHQFQDAPGGYRDGPGPPGLKEIPVHVGDPPGRYRDVFRGGPPFREQGNIPFREGQPPYREPGFRGHPQPGYRDNIYRNNPQFRDGLPGNYRDLPPNYRDGPPGSYRPPSHDPREPPPGNFQDPNFRDNYRDVPLDNKGREQIKEGHKSASRNRSGPRRGPDHDRYREREIREREGHPRDHIEKTRDVDKKSNYERGDHVRDDRSRDYRDYDRTRDRDRDYERTSQDRKGKESPKHSKHNEVREKRRSESRGRSRERTNKRLKKEERVRDRSSTDRSRDRKDKDKKIKDKKKKKKEKEKEVEKKKRREKKDKKEKESSNREENVIQNKEIENEPRKEIVDNIIKNDNIEEKSANIVDIPINESNAAKEETIQKVNDLYGDETDDNVDKDILKNYVNKDEQTATNEKEEYVNNDEPFDGIDIQIQPEELDLKIENDNSDKEMLAPLPELSKWEVEDDAADKNKEPGEISSPEEKEDRHKVTSEILKRAENAIFTKTISSVKPIEIKKISSDRLKHYTNESKESMNNIQITVPVTDTEHRSIEVQDKKKRSSKTPPRLSIKDRLGGKVEDVRRPRDSRVVHSTVERVKSRSKTPTREHPYRRVTIDRGQRLHEKVEGNVHRRIASEAVKAEKSELSDKQDRREEKRDRGKYSRSKDGKINKHSEGVNTEFTSGAQVKNEDPKALRERKKSTLDEANFEPDYDETVESENENKSDMNKKSDRSKSPGNSIKKVKTINETIKLQLGPAKRKVDTNSESSSSDSSSSSSSSDGHKRKRKKKHSKKKKKRAASDSDSDSGSSSDDHKKKKKKRKHKKKSIKKKKKSKHK